MHALSNSALPAFNKSAANQRERTRIIPGPIRVYSRTSRLSLEGFFCRLSSPRAALCRSRRVSPHGKIALLVKTNDYDPKRRDTMNRLFFLTLMALISSAGLAQQGSRLPDNKELVTRARSYYVETDTFYMKREALESSLLGQKEFKAWDLQVTGRKDLADMIVRVKRVPFSNHFSYTVTDRETDTIVMAGKVDSLAGTVYGRIAKEIVDKMVALRGNPLPAQKEAQQASEAK
jgi:hypothetical protein